MAPKKNKSRVEEETVANMSTGWRKSKMSESLVQELENMGLLQAQGVIQWHAGEGEDYPMEGTLETVMFRDFVESNYIILLPNPSCIFPFLPISVKPSLGFFPISIFSNISSSLFLSPMPPILPSSGDVN